MRDRRAWVLGLSVAVVLALVALRAFTWWGSRSLHVTVDDDAVTSDAAPAPPRMANARVAPADAAGEAPADTAGEASADAAPPEAGSEPPAPDADEPQSLLERLIARARKEGPDDSDPFDALGDRAARWADVDLDALHRKLPDNLYWTMAMPTSDPEILKAREEERAHWNVEYGKVLSNTATAEEIDAYYAHRQQMSVDYVEFVTELVTDYGEELPVRDLGLLKLAVELHLARLEEIPRQLAEAQERRVAHEAARQAWLEQQRAFETDSPPAR